MTDAELELDKAATQVCIEVAFLVPRGTNVMEHSITRALDRYRAALINLIKERQNQTTGPDITD